MERFLQKFKISMRLDSFGKYYDAAKEEYSRHGDAILNFEKYTVFSELKEDIRRVKSGLMADGDNILFCYFLNAAIRADDREAINALSSPRAEDKSELYDSISIFALLYELPKMVGELRRRGVPDDVVADTLMMFENQVGDYIAVNGRIGLASYVCWMIKFIKCKIIRVGRFNFEICNYSCPFDIFERDGELVALANGAEIHKSGRILGSAACEDTDGSFVASLTEENGFVSGYKSLGGRVSDVPVRLDMREWKRVLTGGDKVVSVHIPTGERMTPEMCDRDLLRGQKIFDECISDFKMFYCSSWLLETELERVTGKRGNITSFAERFTRFPIKSQGDGVFECVFDTTPDTPLEELKEKSRFATAIKQYLLSGGKIYGAAGVFKRFSDKEIPIALIPCPLQIVVDDVGWRNGADDRLAGGPSRTGMPRNHVPEDYTALNELGRRIGMKINCAFVIGEWDPDNRLRSIPHLSKYADGWDNARFVDKDEMKKIVKIINDSPYIDIAVHGLLHGYYMDGVDNTDISDYYYLKGGKLIMTDDGEIRRRLDKFFELLEYYGVKKDVTSFVPPSFNYRWGELSHILRDYGIKYLSTIFRTMLYEGERPSIAGVENGIITVDRNTNFYPWDEENSSYENIPFVQGIFGAHWPNFLHMDPSRNSEVVDRAVRYFEAASEKYGTVISSGIDFCAVQSLYHRFAKIEYSDSEMTVDISSVTVLIGRRDDFVISAAREPKEVIGAEISLRERKGEFANYILTPSADEVKIKF